MCLAIGSIRFSGFCGLRALPCIGSLGACPEARDHATRHSAHCAGRDLGAAGRHLADTSGRYVHCAGRDLGAAGRQLADAPTLCAAGHLADVFGRLSGGCAVFIKLKNTIFVFLFFSGPIFNHLYHSRPVSCSG